MRDSLRGIVEYDTWFKAKVQAAQTDPRPAIDTHEWDLIRAQKLAQRQALANKA
ncbi:MAG: antitoxin [Betaproteobacteria bacterium]|nr:antitoxin [Betaproteobacteria bacterium]